MIRFVTDINSDAQSVLNQRLQREKTAMRALGISLCVAFTVWMAAAGALAYFSHGIATFIVAHWL